MELFTAFKLLALPFFCWIAGTEILQEREDGEVWIVYIVRRGTNYLRELIPEKQKIPRRKRSPLLGKKA